MKPVLFYFRKEESSYRCPPQLEEQMRAVGKVLLTGAAAVVAWKVLAGVFVGLLAWALKIGLVVAVVYFLLNIFNGKKEKEEE